MRSVDYPVSPSVRNPTSERSLEESGIRRVALEEDILHLAVRMRHPVDRDALEKLVPNIQLRAQTVASC
jgi:hypothetical protein